MGGPGANLENGPGAVPDTVPMVAPVTPDYAGSGLVNLVAEVELRLSGASAQKGLVGREIPSGDGYVIVLFDGLGMHQLEHSSCRPLAESAAGDLTAGFPTTTTTSMATLATGLTPSAHGLIGHVLHLPGVAEAVNVLKWVTPSGDHVAHDYASMLPAPNLWERMSAAGVEPITVQPGPFLGTPLSRLLYRGCRFEPAWSVEEMVKATLDVAAPGRLVLTYFPEVDVAAHVTGQNSDAYRQALQKAVGIWEELSARLPADIGLVGTADHGHIDYLVADKQLIRDRRFDSLRFFGDPRSVYVSGPADTIDDLVVATGAESVGPKELLDLLGRGPVHPDLQRRLPDRLLLAPPGKVLLPRPFDKRLIGYHGGLEREEMTVPLLVRG